MKRFKEIEREGEITLGRELILTNKQARALEAHQKRDPYPTWELAEDQTNLESHPDDDDEPDDEPVEAKTETEQSTAEVEATTTEPIKTDEVPPVIVTENATNPKRSGSKAQ